MNISVLGCGRWGSFIAWYLEKVGHKVILWGRDSSNKLKELLSIGRNNFLEINKNILITSDLSTALKSSSLVVISINAQSLRSFLQEIKLQFLEELKNKVFVLCMKGIEENTGKRLSQVLKECLGEESRVAVWIGPGHVQDFVNGIPNCMVIDSENKSLKMDLVKNLSSNLIRFYFGTDLIGNEIGAAAKNVMGIAAGILDGMNLSSLKGSLMSRGTREISRLIKALGGNELSAYGLAHLGDYEATLFSPYSNNRLFGECFVTGLPCNKLAEGVSTSKALLTLSRKFSVDLPISQAVNDIITKKTTPEIVISSLFVRSLKPEF